MAKDPPSAAELAKLTGIYLPLRTIDDAMRWLEELARRTSRGEMLVDPAEQCRRAIDGWVKAWQAKEKADPASVAKKAFTAEAAARAARELSPADAKRILMERNVGLVIEILDPQRLDTPALEEIPLLEVHYEPEPAKESVPLQLDDLF